MPEGEEDNDDDDEEEERYASFIPVTLTTACYKNIHARTDAIHARAYSQNSFLLGGI
jgi:hypothetical protein